MKQQNQQSKLLNQLLLFLMLKLLLLKVLDPRALDPEHQTQICWLLPIVQ